jgi:topoisomerase-4 subunit A
VKGFKAHGKRISNYEIESIVELEPARFPEEPEDNEDGDDSANTVLQENEDPDAGKSEQQIIDEMTGQLSLDF